MLHVLLVVPWDQTHGGVNTVVRNLARFLQETGRGPHFLFPGNATVPRSGLSRLGFAATYMNLRPPLVRRRLLRSVVAFWLTAPISLWYLVRLVRRQKIDIVNVHYPDLNFVHFVALRRLTGVRLVTSVHGGDLTSLPKRSLARRLMSRLLAHSDVVVAPSQEFGEYVRSEFPSTASRVISISNAIDVQEVRELATSPAAPGDLTPPQGPYCLCVAALNRKKAHDVLLRAFVQVPAPVRLLLVGDGPLHAELVSLVAQLGLTERVDFLGAQAPAVVAKLQAGALCAVLASRDEPFGIAAVESMAVGTPVIATDIGGLREIVKHEESGLVVPVDDERALAAALTRLTSDAELRERLGRAAAERAESLFDWREWGSFYVDAAYMSSGAHSAAGRLVSPSAPAAAQA
ncbi:MAG TPA: glycosyltransferase family 4 protein [Gemmatimonadaceae bacterium]